MEKRVVVFGSSSLKEDSRPYSQALAFGALLAGKGLTVVTGGYFGIMGAVSKGAFEAGGKTVGVVCDTFTFREAHNPWLTTVEGSDCITSRLQKLISKSQAAVAMPGNVGTLNEVLMVITLWKCRETEIPLLLWREPFFSLLTTLREKDFIDQESFERIHWVNDENEAITVLQCLFQ